MPGSRGEWGAEGQGYTRRNESVAMLRKGKWENMKILLQPRVSNTGRRVSGFFRETGKLLLGDQSHKIKKTSVHASADPWHLEMVVNGGFV